MMNLSLAGFVVLVVVLLLFHLPSSTIAFECPGDVDITVAGSTAVEPIARHWATSFENLCTTADVDLDAQVGGSSSDGVLRLCSGQADIAMSDTDEVANLGETSMNCFYAGCLVGDTSVCVIPVAIARDGIAIVGSLLNESDSVAVDCYETVGGLTLHQIRWMFTSLTDAELAAEGLDMTAVTPNNDGDEIREWSDLNANCQEVEIHIVGPNEDSDRQDFFVNTFFLAAQRGETFRDGYIGYEDNSDALYAAITANGTIASYSSFTWYDSFRPQLGASAVIDSDGNPVPPNLDTIGGAYDQLSRRFYMYVRDEPRALATAGEYIRYGFTEDGAFEVRMANFVPLTEDEAETMRDRIDDFCWSEDSKEIYYGLIGIGPPLFYRWFKTCGDIGFFARIFLCRGRVGEICPTQCGNCPSS